MIVVQMTHAFACKPYQDGPPVQSEYPHPLEQSCSRRRAVDRPAVDDGLEQALIEVICTRIDRPTALAIIFESGANIGVQKIRAWNRLRQHSERGGIVRLDFPQKFGRRPVLRSEQ